MKSTVLKEKFKEGLLLTERVCAKSASLPILSNILLSWQKNTIQLSATDLEVGIRYTILAKNEKEGALALSPKAISQFVGLIPGREVTLSLGEHQLALEAGEFKASFRGADPEDFPLIPKPKGNEQFVEVDTKAFCEGLSCVAGFTGQTQARPEISGVLFLLQKNTLKLVSTDSFRLAEKTIKLKKEVAAKSFILPAKASRELISILGEREGSTRMYLSESQAVFDWSQEGQAQEPAIQLVSRLIEGEYPPYQDVIPAKHSTTAIFAKEELANHVRAASLFSGRMNDVQMTLDPTKKQLEISAKSAEVGENTSVMKGDISGAKVSAAFNWRFFSEGLAHIKSEEVKVLLSGEENPALLLPQDSQEGYLYVVMPIKA